MKKILVILLLLLCAGVVYAEKVEISYNRSIKIDTYQENENMTGGFRLWIDGTEWTGGTWHDCNGASWTPAWEISESREIDCGEIQTGTIDVLSHDMGLFIHYFNDTRIALFENYGNCLRDLKTCDVSNEYKKELLKDCNGTNSDWYGLFIESEGRLEACRAKKCYDQVYVDELNENAKNTQWWSIGITIALCGLIGYIMYFKKGLAKSPYHKA